MNEPFKIVIVEDEPISTAYLKKMLKETGIEHQIVGELDSVSESMLFFGKNPYYDLVFMDIHLGDGTCFELLDAKVIEKPIIFCTTFDNYAIQAFKYNSIDYLLKPASQDDIDTAMDKFMNMKNNGEATYFERMDKMLSSLKEPRHKKRFLIKKDNHLELIEAKNIVYFYSEAGHTFLVNNKGEEFLVEGETAMDILLSMGAADDAISAGAE